MPSLEYLTNSNEKQMSDARKPQWLYEQLQSENAKLLILDCRPHNDYALSHIRGAISVALPSLLLRRLGKGNLQIPSIISCNENREKFKKNYKTHTILLCDDFTEDMNSNSASVSDVLLRKLKDEGCQACYLEGGFSAVRYHFPELCVCEKDTTDTILGIKNLRISCNDIDDDSDKCDSCLGTESPIKAPTFPVEILSYLFLGNAKNSTDLETLEKYHIKYILNVTPNLPNAFENDGSIKYLQIPISDHLSQNLAVFFPKAIAFIDEARDNNCAVLVHCLAGISRSVTVTVAYLMHALRMSLNDAYDFVKKRKANISPNFNFMGQLLDFERKLNHSPSIHRHCENHEDCLCHQSHFISPTKSCPDSGILCSHWT